MKTWKKVLIVFACLIVGGILGIVGFRHIVVKNAENKIVRSIEEAKEESYDAIVVLGCGVYQDGSLSPMLKYRLDATSELFWNKVAPIIFVTGDHVEGNYDEVDHMLEYFYTKNISEEWMVPDYEGHSTYESMQHAVEAGYKKVLIVTQEYHLPRAMHIAETYGLDCTGFPAQDWGMSIGTIYRHGREYLATIKDYLYCLIQF